MTDEERANDIALRFAGSTFSDGKDVSEWIYKATLSALKAKGREERERCRDILDQRYQWQTDLGISKGSAEGVREGIRWAERALEARQCAKAVMCEIGDATQDDAK